MVTLHRRRLITTSRTEIISTWSCGISPRILNTAPMPSLTKSTVMVVLLLLPRNRSDYTHNKMKTSWTPLHWITYTVRPSLSTVTNYTPRPLVYITYKTHYKSLFYKAFLVWSYFFSKRANTRIIIYFQYSFNILYNIIWRYYTLECLFLCLLILSTLAS